MKTIQKQPGRQQEQHPGWRRMYFTATSGSAGSSHWSVYSQPQNLQLSSGPSTCLPQL
ncbi:uncharacterized protein METZ01_LOCUS218857 [marine metagenome]|uniref:Uncharacterized protein n=1 Tax=marine metagenome TaxID=408172 RepID=A0A382FUS1_9ZZZZ